MLFQRAQHRAGRLCFRRAIALRAILVMCLISATFSCHRKKALQSEARLHLLTTRLTCASAHGYMSLSLYSSDVLCHESTDHDGAEALGTATFSHLAARRTRFAWDVITLQIFKYGSTCEHTLYGYYKETRQKQNSSSNLHMHSNVSRSQIHTRTVERAQTRALLSSPPLPSPPSLPKPFSSANQPERFAT